MLYISFEILQAVKSIISDFLVLYCLQTFSIVGRVFIHSLIISIFEQMLAKVGSRKTLRPPIYNSIFAQRNIFCISFVYQYTAASSCLLPFLGMVLWLCHKVAYRMSASRITRKFVMLLCNNYYLTH